VKVVKPLRLGFFFRTFEHRRRHHLVCTLLACFPFDDPHALVPESDTWKMLGAEIGRFGMFDQGMWKERGEVLVIGYAHPPQAPQPHCEVRLRLGPIDKQLYVFGNRRWRTIGPSDPEPFDRMPISWERAFGGAGFDDNPAGRGAAKIDDNGKRILPLPNVEHPKRLVRSQGDRPLPASFSPEDFTNHKRFKRMGTYDGAWRDNRFPGLADDIDWGVFNVAQTDQQLPGMFEGGEAFELTNMHPDKARISGVVPRLRARCWLARGRSEDLVEAPARLDTVVLLPHLERGIALYRSVTPIESYDAHEITEVVAALEDPDENRPRAHYVEALENRLDRERLHLYALRDRDLLPASLSKLPVVPTVTDPVIAAVENEGMALERLHRRVGSKIEETKEMLRAAGFEPPETEPLPSLDALRMGDVAAVIEQNEQRGGVREEIERRVRERCDEGGIDYETLRARSDEPPGGPPDFRAEAHLSLLRGLAEASRKAGAPNVALETKISDPAFHREVEKRERDLLELYRSSAHFQGPATLPDDRARDLARQRVIVACDAGESLEGVDLTGVDLSGLELRGAPLAGALLERANLDGANLDDANLEGAVLTRATLAGARLNGARLARANLGHAALVGAELEGCDLTDAILDEADLSEARLDGANLSGTTLAKLRGGASFRRVKATRLLFHDTDLTGSCWEGAHLRECIFLSVDVSGVSFADTELEKTCFVKARGRAASFVRSKLVSFALLDGTTFEESDFTGALMDGSNLRGSTLARATFVGASVRQSDFSDADLSDANLSRANAAMSYFVRTVLTRARCDGAQLMNAIFHYAKLGATSFTGANLFSADFSRAVGDHDTSFAKANVARVVKMKVS
jgi:uncharacterized protein YjbI with pentapeptide repeats